MFGFSDVINMTGSFLSTQFRGLLFLMFQLASIHDASCGRVEPGIWNDLILATDNTSAGFRALTKTMFKDTVVKISVQEIDVCGPSTDYVLSWELRYTRCTQLYTLKREEIPVDTLALTPSAMFSVEPEISVMANTTALLQCPPDLDDPEYPKFAPSNVTTCYLPPSTWSSGTRCEKGWILDADAAGQTQTEGEKSENEDANKNKGEDGDKNKDEDQNKPKSSETPAENGSRRRKRADDISNSGGGNETKIPDDGKKNNSSDDGKKTPTPGKVEKHVVATTPATGSYLLILNISAINMEAKFGNVSLKVRVEMKGPNGYLSASQYPLLKFYGIMCGVYTLFAFTWLFLLCRQYQDLLGIQIWIGVVILLGLIEKAAFYGEFEHVNNKGGESDTGVLLAELVSCVKRTLARLLVVVVSIGYGITRPRLGTDLNYIMAAGLLYMTLSSAEAIMRVSETYEHSMVAILPLSVLEAILVWWILRNLVDTTRTLRLRNNETKLWLYRHFTNTLLLCVVFSVIFSIWTMKTHKLSGCVEKHYELWLDDAFWHILFCVILFVVMILFRPSANNQRYAYSPLIDEEQEDEESKEPMLSEAYDGMKMRNLKKDTQENPVKNIADDLKWVEDNIPAAIADSALAIMDDSEEELVTNLERSKMD